MTKIRIDTYEENGTISFGFSIKDRWYGRYSIVLDDCSLEPLKFYYINDCIEYAMRYAWACGYGSVRKVTLR